MGKANTRYEDGSTVEYEHPEAWVGMRVWGFVRELLKEEVEALLGRTKSEKRKAVDAPRGRRKRLRQAPEDAVDAGNNYTFWPSSALGKEG
jgi:hypothetical protein